MTDNYLQLNEKKTKANLSILVFVFFKLRNIAKESSVVTEVEMKMIMHAFITSGLLQDYFYLSESNPIKYKIKY